MEGLHRKIDKPDEKELLATVGMLQIKHDIIFEYLAAAAAYDASLSDAQKKILTPLLEQQQPHDTDDAVLVLIAQARDSLVNAVKKFTLELQNVERQLNTNKGLLERFIRQNRSQMAELQLNADAVESNASLLERRKSTVQMEESILYNLSNNLTC